MLTLRVWALEGCWLFDFRSLWELVDFEIYLLREHCNLWALRHRGLLRAFGWKDRSYPVGFDTKLLLEGLWAFMNIEMNLLTLLCLEGDRVFKWAWGYKSSCFFSFSFTGLYHRVGGQLDQIRGLGK